MEEMLETVVCAPHRADESASEHMSDSEDYYGDESQGQARSNTDARRHGGDFKMSLQVIDLQTVEMDCASSPYSYAFRIDAFARKVSGADGEFQSIGPGKFVRQDEGALVHLEETPIDPHIADYLVDYYFRELWPSFPIIDQDALYNQLRDTKSPPPISILTAIYFAAASTISQNSTVISEMPSAMSSPTLSPRSMSSLPPGLVDSLRSSLTKILTNLSTPILEPRITTLQTIILRCLYDNTLSSEFRTVLISDAIRISQYILLHRSITNLPARDQSLRKRLWWTIFLLEVWTSSRDRTSCAIDLGEVDISQPIESEEPNHQGFVALVALTRILLDTLRRVYGPNVNYQEVPREVVRLRGWVMDWYCNLPKELLVTENEVGGETADFLLATCHTVLLLLYSPFKDENMVRSEIERSRGIIADALGRLGRGGRKFGIIVNLVGEMVRRLAL
jgi:hypothetical protein